jgi:DNA-binding MarR family transcriptional regulator
MTDAEHIFDRLLEIALLIQDDLATSFAGTGLTTARTHLLWVLHHSGPSNQQSLAAALSVSPRNVTGLVDALEAGEFVERRPHPSDRRATLVTLTERGTETMAAMARDRQAVAAQLVEGFGAGRVDRLGSDLDTIAERLQQMVEAARPTAESA